ncbi:MAG: hypothetical protein ACRDTT_34215 [Pseudonocardiaceae bacterium]
MTSEVTEWLALLRAHEGGVTKLTGHYLNCGRPVACYLADVLDELIDTGFLALAQPSPIGQQRVCVTHTGQARYAVLSEQGTSARTEAVADADR